MSRYAANTTVSVEKSRAEVEATLVRYGASSFMYIMLPDGQTVGQLLGPQLDVAYGWDADGAMIAFVMEVGDGQRRQVRFHLSLPSRDERRFTQHSRGKRTPEAAENLWEQACRQRWRALGKKLVLERGNSSLYGFEFRLDDECDDPDKGVMPHGLELEAGNG